MNKQKINDLEYGFRSEEEIHGILEEQFGTLFRSSKNPEMGKYYPFDKYNEEYFIELKTRRIPHDKHETLFFGLNKLEKADNLLKKNPFLRIFYLWRCIDMIVGWEHRSSEYEICKRGRNDRGIDEFDDCVDIKQKYIKPLSELLTSYDP
jgi:hypothetical protein